MRVAQKKIVKIKNDEFNLIILFSKLKQPNEHELCTGNKG
jgi:hypothetical protein